MFKYIYLYSLSFLFSIESEAQNIIVNGNFEQYSTCPTNTGQFSTCSSWRAYTGASTDYYNLCAGSSSNVSVPANFLGTQNAAGGVGYAGIITYEYSSGIDYKEYAASSFSALQTGVTYEFSMSISLSASSPS